MPRSRFRPNGVNVDVPAVAVDLGAWTGARNMLPREGMERAGGEKVAYGTPIGAPRHHFSATSNAGGHVWVYGSDLPAIGVTDGQTHIDITPTGYVTPTAGALSPWTSGVINQIPVINSIGNPPVYWDRQYTAAPAATLPGWPSGTFANAIRAYRYHLIALGTSADPDLVMWSDRAPAGTLPATWAPAPTNEAGSGNVGVGGGVLLDGARLGSRFMVYKSNQCFELDYVGGTQVMTLHPLFPIGAWSRNCIATLGGLHCVLGDSDVIAHDGSTYQSIASGLVRRTVIRALATDTRTVAFVAADPLMGELWVCLPEAGSTWPNYALVWSRVTGKWGIRELAYQASHIEGGDAALSVQSNTWDADSQVWDLDFSVWDASSGAASNLALVASSVVQSAFYVLDSGDLRYDGGPIPWRLERAGLDCGDESLTKVLTRVRLELKAPSGGIVQVRGGGQMNADDAIVYSAPVQWDPLTSDTVPIFARGRYLSILLEGSQASAPPVVTGFTLEYSDAGRF